MGLVPPVGFCGSSKSWQCWICGPPSRVSLGAAPVDAVVSASIRKFIYPGPQSEPVLDKSDAEPGSTSVLGGVRCMQEESQQETDELERYRDEHVPEEGEERSCRESLYDHFAREGGRGKAGREVNRGGLPIRWDSIGLSGSVGWWGISLGFLGR